MLLRDEAFDPLREQGEAVGLGLLGAWVHWKRDRRSFWYFGTFMLTLTVLLIYYLNFRYGHSQAPSLGETVDREVRDRELAARTAQERVVIRLQPVRLFGLSSV